MTKQEINNLENVIYAIVNLIDNKLYIGSTVNKFYKRKSKHKRDLERNVHHSILLQRAYNKYGKENFIFEILEVCNNYEELIKKELYWVEIKKSMIPEYGYNISSPQKNGPYKRIVSLEERKRRSIKAIENYKSKDLRLKISNTLSKHYENLENRIMLSLNCKGKVHRDRRLSKNDILEIKNKYNNNVSQYSLAKEYNINQSLVSRIVNNKAYIENGN